MLKVICNEETAVLKVVALFSNLSQKNINAWKSSGIKKFQHLDYEKPDELNDELLVDDLNEKLDELSLFENDF